MLGDITRLVVKARASGIHVILATQRPDINFLPSRLRSNFQCRVAFTTSDMWNSRIILGRKGAENLKGKGDGLFKTNDGQSNIRFQSALITEKEIKKAVSMMLEK
jgi:S-DNA-T family DNA segregation ATPase FtsK/SpoIIIE